MAATYYRFYKNLIQNKAYSKEEMIAKVADAYEKRRLTESEYNELNAFIESIYK